MVNISIIDDEIPEPHREFTISVESIVIAGGREGLPPRTSGVVFVEIYDNDCKFTNYYYYYYYY